MPIYSLGYSQYILRKKQLIIYQSLLLGGLKINWHTVEQSGTKRTICQTIKANFRDDRLFKEKLLAIADLLCSRLGCLWFTRLFPLFWNPHCHTYSKRLWAFIKTVSVRIMNLPKTVSFQGFLSIFHPDIPPPPPLPHCPVGLDCRIHRLLLCRGVRPPPQVVS